MNFVMRLLRHLSIRKLALLSVGMILLPVLTGLASTFLTMEGLSAQARQAVHQVAKESKLFQDLQERLLEVERAAGAFLHYQDSRAFGEFQTAHSRFGEQLQGILATEAAGDNRLADKLERLGEEEKNAFDTIASLHPVRPERPSAPAFSKGGAPSVAERFQSVNAGVHELSSVYSEHVDREAGRVDALFGEAKRRLVIQIAALFSITCMLLGVFVYLLNSPIRQIDHVIRTLGAGNFTRPVQVSGTADVVYLGERLEWLRSRLNDLELAKQRFVRNVSHEIKTPLATLHEGTDLLLDEVVGELNLEQKDIARILAENTRKLDQMIAALINYSQVSARMERQKLSLVNMRSLVLGLLDDYQLQLRGKSIGTAASLESLEVMGDVEQLRTIVDNLLSNAVKYSPSGGEIRLSLRKDGGHMVLEIEDDGPGIDPDERARVFEPFFQGRAARELGVKGTGFGLAIVGECVASHHGKVEVLDSLDENAGARIRVQIPMQSQ